MSYFLLALEVGGIAIGVWLAVCICLGFCLSGFATLVLAFMPHQRKVFYYQVQRCIPDNNCPNRDNVGHYWGEKVAWSILNPRGPDWRIYPAAAIEAFFEMFFCLLPYPINSLRDFVKRRRWIYPQKKPRGTYTYKPKRSQVARPEVWLRY